MAEDASSEQIRRAYRALVRRYHPDHLGVRASDPSAAADAERRIRDLNTAWQVLRDPDRRERYDRALPAPTRTVAYSPFPPGTEPEPIEGFEEWFAAPPRQHDVTPASRHTPRPVKPFRLRLLVGLGVVMLGGILLVVAITGRSNVDVSPGVGTGECVRVQQGVEAVPVSCSSPNDGRVVDRVTVSGACPGGASADRLYPGDQQMTCLAPSGG